MPELTKQGSPEWFHLEGEAFLRQAYQHLLGRPVDPLGLRNYVEKLKAGIPKSQIVAELEDSPEGRLAARRRNWSDVGARSGTARALLGQKGGLVPTAQSLKPIIPVADVFELFKLHGEVFVRTAYLSLFKREADPDGLAHYTDVLRNGYSRSHVLQVLANSPEAREKSVDLRGLRAVVVQYRKGQARTWSGWYWRNVRGVESDLPPARELRMLCLREH